MTSLHETRIGPFSAGALRKRILIGGLTFLVGVCAIPYGHAAWADEVKIRSVKKPGKKDRPGDKAIQKNLKMNEVEILGEFEKPKTMFVIPRAPHEYFWEDYRVDYTEDILSPVSKQKVEGMQKWRNETSTP